MKLITPPSQLLESLQEEIVNIDLGTVYSQFSSMFEEDYHKANEGCKYCKASDLQAQY